jgi:dipeptidase E
MNLMMPYQLKAEGILQEEATPLLVAELYKNNIMNALAASIKRNVPRNKARSVICGLSMQTTDMPIVYPPNFKTLGILPFDLNAHFLDADLQSKHMVKLETSE